MDVAFAGGAFGLSERQKTLLTNFLDAILRIPGVFLLEMWWIKHDAAVSEFKNKMQQSALPRYLEMAHILEFVDNRDVDTAAAGILSFAVLLLCGILMAVPVTKLLKLYLHVASLLLFALAHVLSIRYVTLEVEDNDIELKLDDLTKLERHGFHFLAQLMLALTQSVILSIESDVGRVALAVFSLPIAARMCGCPVNKLMIAHNVACSATMLLISIYVLSYVPVFLSYLKQCTRKVRSIFAIRGIGVGVVNIWQRLRIAEVLAISWIFMFALRLYSQVTSNVLSIDTAFMAAVAETTSSPFTLLALALTVSYVSHAIVQLTQLVLGSELDNEHVLANQGYTEAFTLVFLCCQAGVLGMHTEQKTLMLKLVLFIVLSALLQSLYEILEPQMLAFSASSRVTWSMHVRALSFSSVLMITPVLISGMLMAFLPMDLWFVMIISNCLLTTVRSISTTVIYFIHIAENRMMTPLERFDDLVFLCKTLTHLAEFLLALVVVCYGVYSSLVLSKYTVFSMVVLVFHTYFNVYRRLKSSIMAIRTRNAAYEKINAFDKPTPDEIAAKSSVCMICLGEMDDDARITPCKHLFHGFCLRKWLFVKAVCPLCYVSLADGIKLFGPQEPQYMFRRRRQAELNAQLFGPSHDDLPEHHEAVDGYADDAFSSASSSGLGTTDSIQAGESASLPGDRLAYVWAANSESSGEERPMLINRRGSRHGTT